MDRSAATAAFASLCLLGTLGAARGAVVFSDDFSGAFPGRWTPVNASSPVGINAAGWYHGSVDTDLSAHGTGAARQQFASSNYETAGSGPGAVSSVWLISPTLAFRGGDQIGFDVCGTGDENFADRVQVRLSTSGTSTDTGPSATSVGSFDRLLLDVNPDYATSPDPAAVPAAWTRFTVTLSGLGGGPVAGRFAFRYFVEDSGPDGSRGNEIGIDNVTVVPEPSAPAAAAAGAAGLVRRRRRPGR